MPRPRLNIQKDSIQVFMPLEDKKALQRWCNANQMTISEVARGELKSKIDEGYSIK